MGNNENMIRLIAAIDRTQGMAKQGILPWHIPEDEQYFTDQTKTHGGHVLTGMTTFQKTYTHGPLAERHNYILTHDKTPIEGVTLVHDLEKFLDDFREKDLWVSGGASVFAQIVALGRADELYLTHIDADFGCNQFFPNYKGRFKLTERTELKEQNGFIYYYARYARQS